MIHRTGNELRFLGDPVGLLDAFVVMMVEIVTTYLVPLRPLRRDPTVEGSLRSTSQHIEELGPYRF